MDIIFSALAPIVLIVILGWALGYFKLVKPEVGGALMQYVFYAAAPAVIIWAISKYSFKELLNWKFWIAYPLSLLIVILLTSAIFKFILKRNIYWSWLSGTSAAYANTVLVGFPVLASIAGHRAAIPMAITVIVGNVFLAPVVIFLFEMASRQTEAENFSKLFKSAFLGTLRSPILIGVVIGLILSVMNVHLPNFLESFIKLLGLSIGPCALFAIGLGLSNFHCKGNLLDISIITAINLLLMPLIALGLAVGFEMSPFYAVSLVIFATVPSAKTLYIFAGKYGVYEKEMAAIISFTTLLSVITIPAYLYVCTLIWPSLFS